MKVSSSCCWSTLLVMIHLILAFIVALSSPVDAFAVDLDSSSRFLSPPKPKQQQQQQSNKDKSKPRTDEEVEVWILNKMNGDSSANTRERRRQQHDTLVFDESSSNTAAAAAAGIQAFQEARDLAQQAGYNELQAWLTAGGDDRSLIEPSTATNKYHIRPHPIAANAIFRGSCTGNPPTTRGYQAAQQLYDQVFEPALLVVGDNNNNDNDDDEEGSSSLSLERTLGQVFAQQRARLAQLLDLPKGAEVMLCPSGSDAEYLPVAIARVLLSLDANHADDKVITNGLTQLREIGSGSAPAAAGQYFSTHAPLIGQVENYGGDNDVDEPYFLAGMGGGSSISNDEQTTTTSMDNNNNANNNNAGQQQQQLLSTVTARAPDGSVVDAAAAMHDFCQQAQSQGMYPVVHSVFGGKTGLRDGGLPTDLLGPAGKYGLGVVDACQGRFTKAELGEWMDQDALVLFTGSKFYQAPPFCGAVIVPPGIAGRLTEASSLPPALKGMLGRDGVGGFVTDKELPECCHSWKQALRGSTTTGEGGGDETANNVGLALRWQAGLAGMEALAEAVPACQDRTEAVDEWARAVVNMVQEHQPVLDAWCVQRSIISIRVAKNGDGGWLNMSELRDLYRWMSMDVAHAVPNATPEERVALSTPAYIGQPVDVADSHAIVRIALGVDSLISYVEDKDGTLQEDNLTVQKLAAIGNHFDVLKQSGL